jgi:hypothetical protein
MVFRKAFRIANNFAVNWSNLLKRRQITGAVVMIFLNIFAEKFGENIGRSFAEFFTFIGSFPREISAGKFAGKYVFQRNKSKPGDNPTTIEVGVVTFYRVGSSQTKKENTYRFSDGKRTNGNTQQGDHIGEIITVRSIFRFKISLQFYTKY